MDNRKVVSSSNQSGKFRAWICAALRGAPIAWRWPDDAQTIEAFVAEVDLEGVGPLLHRHCSLEWPAAVRDALHRRAAAGAMWELHHQQALTEALHSLSHSGVQAILIKGTPLAYSHYADASLRPRGDTDLVIPPAMVVQACTALEAQGFRRENAVRGRFISYQSTFTKVDTAGFTHALDVHWRLNNSEVLSKLLTYDELAQDALPLAALGTTALAASPVHSLLIACIHRCSHRQNPYFVDEVAHHTDSRLIWLYDIHVLAQSLTATQWESLGALARQKNLVALCKESLLLTQSCFETRLPASVTESLATSDADAAPSRYLESSKARQQWMDFVALRNPLDQLQFIRELVFPPVAYMRAKFPDDAPALLGWRYVMRAARGVGKRLLGTDASR